MDINLLLQSAEAEVAVSKLIAGNDLEPDDLIAIGRLNFHAFVKHYEPVAALWDSNPRLDPDVRQLLTEE